MAGNEKNLYRLYSFLEKVYTWFMWTGEQKSIIATAALTEMNSDYKLDFWQDWYLRSSEKFLIVNKSRSIGRSYITSLKSIIEANSPDV
jgi:hypothetical protein